VEGGRAHVNVCTPVCTCCACTPCHVQGVTEKLNHQRQMWQNLTTRAGIGEFCALFFQFFYKLEIITKRVKMELM
jgi:hypothetical protein